MLGVLLGRALNADVQQRFLDSSRTSATLITQVGVQPLLTAQQMTTGLTPAQVAQIDEELQGARASDEVRRLKVWNSRGTIVYSDNHSLIGRTFAIDDDLQGALQGHPRASITSGQDEENSGDNLVGPLIQVYVPLKFEGTSAPSGAFELYMPYAPVQAAVDSESRQLYEVLAIGLAVFYLSMFPVVLFANRWRRRAEATAMENLAILARLNSLKTEFLIRIRHQFRTALVGIEGFSELIRDSERLDVEEVRSLANSIYHDAQRLDEAFSEMIELDRMEAGRSRLAVSSIDMNGLIQEVVADFRADLPHRVLRLQLESAAASVTCDRGKIAQVLSILIGNAVTYSPSDSEVVVTCEVDGEQVQVGVKDHGPGMPAGYDKPLVVPPHGQAREGAGTGLGLAIARQAIALHSGRIWFESKPGEGTAVYFTLPMHAAPSRARTPVGTTNAAP